MKIPLIRNWLVGVCCFGFTTVAAQLLATAEELNNLSQEAPIVKRVQGLPNGFVRVTWSDGRKLRLADSRIWGYRDQKGLVYRYVDGHFYELYRRGPLMLYVLVEFGDLPRNVFYFSRTADGPVQYLNYRNLAMSFQDFPCMLSRLASLKRKGIHQHMVQLAESYRLCLLDSSSVPYTKTVNP